jgi:hypothetical protein
MLKTIFKRYELKDVKRGGGILLRALKVRGSPPSRGWSRRGVVAVGGPAGEGVGGSLHVPGSYNEATIRWVVDILRGCYLIRVLEVFSTIIKPMR